MAKAGLKQTPLRKAASGGKKKGRYPRRTVGEKQKAGGYRLARKLSSKQARRSSAEKRIAKPRALVVIPAHNEESTIREVVTQSLEYADVSVTDDGSRDGTFDILQKVQTESRRGKYAHRLNIVRHPAATHIPRAVQDGLKWGVVRKEYNYFITMDAGLSHDPDALADFLAADPGADVVMGSRRRPENVPAYRRLVSKLGALVINYALSRSYFNFAGPRLKDCTSGFRRYSRRAAEAIAGAELRSKAFDFHMEALALCLRRGMRAAEIPITYVFSNSSFNRKVLWQAIKFGIYFILTKRTGKSATQIASE